MQKEALFFDVLADGVVACRLCHHHCKIAPDQFGLCGMRQNQEGHLITHAYGEIIAAHVDPIEKKPLYHVLPGSHAFSIATMGCNFKCDFCQNWQISQINNKVGARGAAFPMMPADIVADAEKQGCRSIAYTYTEPTIFFEYAYETARLAHQRGLCNVFVSNGFMGAEALEMIQPYLDACNIDLKAFSDAFYRKACKARLQPVLDNIRRMRRLNIWVEVTTLVIPGQNDDDEQLEGIAAFLARVDRDIPWHLSRFHPDYQMTDVGITPLATLQKAAEIGKRAGLRYIYIGNVVSPSSDTNCPSCGRSVIDRRGYAVSGIRVHDGRCDACRASIAGIFD